MRLKCLPIFFLCLVIFCSCSVIVKAEDYQNNYNVEYFLNEDKDSLVSHVKFTVTITNLRSDLYVKKFGLAFPKSFAIKNLNASDSDGTIKPSITEDNKKTRVEMEFTEPEIGKNTRNSFFLEFDQESLFKVNGNVWEVILPVIETNPGDSYHVSVNLPQNSNKKISIAKPKPNQIEGKRVIWNNPTSKTIYAVFGDKQIYNMKLSYHLQNDRLTPVYTDIAFPPDTLYQKIFVNSIDPKPNSVYVDEDGNYIGRYNLKPKENLDVLFDGVSELSVAPRDEVKSIQTEEINQQRAYLKQTKGYWEIKDASKISHLAQPDQIYSYLVDKYSYNYQRVNKSVDRLGAQKALDNPDQVVCVEFADSFVAMARRNGILAREIEGYGFSNDPQLRPLSLISDVLHSWPEFYDKDQELWRPVDPTWENTSGIDYYNSFDLNHIVFAIHGKEADYPFPAGMYKIDNSRDISITATNTEPVGTSILEVLPLTIGDRLTGKREYNIKLSVTNKGNIFVWNTPLKIVGKNIALASDYTVISEIAPLETKDIDVIFTTPDNNAKLIGSLQLKIGDQTINKTFAIVPYYYDLGIKVALVLFTVLVVVFLAQMMRGLSKRRK